MVRRVLYNDKPIRRNTNGEIHEMSSVLNIAACTFTANSRFFRRTLRGMRYYAFNFE